MVSVVSRFVATRMVTPLEKLEEMLAQPVIDRDALLDLLEEVFGCVEKTAVGLSQVQFPVSYEAGPVLLRYARQGLVAYEEALDGMCQAAEEGHWQALPGLLQQLRGASQSLNEILTEIQVEKYRL